MITTANWRRSVQLIVVLICGAALKLYYSTASVNQLRWILAPTTLLVELISGTRFQFESHVGYISWDRTFLIAASCAGVNFLITAFLMLSLKKLWNRRTQRLPWPFILATAMFAYVTTVVANAVRISMALRLRTMSTAIHWLNPNELHRFQGVLIYFGFLLLLFLVSENHYRSESGSEQIFLSKRLFGRPATQFLFPLLIYYATTLGIPLLDGAYRQGAEFWEHALFVLLIPVFLVIALATFRFLQPRGDDTVNNQ